MKLQEFAIPNRLNAAVVCVQLLLVCACFFGLRAIDSAYELLVLAVAFGLVMNSVYSTIHEAHHRLLFSHPGINDAAGICLSLLFPAPFHLLRQGHLGHHRCNRSDDEAFDLYFDRDHKLWKFAAWYGILLGLYWVVVALSNVILLLGPALMNPRLWRWDKTSEVFLRHFSDSSFRAMRLEAAAAVTLHSALVFLLAVPWQNYALMYFGFGWIWSSLQYVHHYQTTRHVLDGARNLHLARLIDLFWLDHNYHLTHHQMPMIPWVYLKRVADERCVKSSALLPAYLRMWKGPRRAELQVSNSYDGAVTR